MAIDRVWRQEGAGGQREAEITAQALPERALLERFVWRDWTALQVLYERSSPAMLAYFRGQVADPTVVEDLQQALFIELALTADHFDPARPLLPWLQKLASRLLGRYRRRVAQASLQQPLEQVPAAALLDESADPSTGYLRRQQAEVLAHAVAQLPQPQQVVLVGRFYAGQSFAELAARLQISEANARQRLHAGLKRLRRRLPALLEGR